MILVHVLIKVGIVAGCVILFVVTFLLNKKVKAPKIDDKLKQCADCTSTSCVIKISELEEIKKEYEKEFPNDKEILNEINKNCEKENKDEK